MRQLPDDLRVEVLLDYLPEGSFNVSFCGLHKRNACKDLLGMETANNGCQTLGLARMSLYDLLPEYFFHPFDRFSQMVGRENRERFIDELGRQEKEKEEAIAFFAPVDCALLALKSNVYRQVLPLGAENKVLQDILSDQLSEEQRKNRFIQRTIPFLPEVKRMRGDRTLLTLLLRKLFKEENMDLVPIEEVRLMEDEEPRYEDSEGGTLGNTFAGNRYEEHVLCYSVQYWSDEECDERFLQFVEDMELFRRYVCDWFLSIEEDLLIEIVNRKSATWLSDTLTHGYLGYNTNL